MKNVEMRLDNASMTEAQRIEPTFEGVKVRNPDLARPMFVKCSPGLGELGSAWPEVGGEVRVHSANGWVGTGQRKLLEL